MATNDTGTVLWSWNSNAFGTTQQNLDVDGDNVNFPFILRFPGQLFDPESNNHYNYYRDYEPGAGRYLQSDPIGLEGGWNTFVYTLANPINYFDRNGGQTEGTLTVCVIGGPYNPACDAAVIINVCKYVGLGLAAAWGYFSTTDDTNDCDEDCENKKDRCKKVKESCIKGCSTFVFGKKKRLWENGWSGDDFSKCLRQCMERENCY